MAATVPASTPTPPTVPPFALHLVHGVWVASCPDCGHELGRSPDQVAAERAGERRRCPIVLRHVCVRHRHQLIALHAAGLADRIRWTCDGLATR